MSEQDTVIESIKEMLKEPEKNFVHFPLKDLQAKQLLLTQILESSEIRQALTEEEVKIFKERVLIKLVTRLTGLNEIVQVAVSAIFTIYSRFTFFFIFTIRIYVKRYFHYSRKKIYLKFKLFVL